MTRSTAIAILCLALGWQSFAVSPIQIDRTPGGHGSWTNISGVPWGIATNRAIFATFPIGTSQSTVQAALGSCPTNQSVKLGPGNWNIDLTITKDGVTLIGSGKNFTTNTGRILLGQSVNSFFTEMTTAIPANHRAWTGNYQQGTNVIYATNTSGLSVGQLIMLDQYNDTNTISFSPVNPDGPYVNAEYHSLAFPSSGRDRYQFQVNRIIAISGTNITLAEPIYAANWNIQGTNQPQFWFLTTPTLVQNSSIEDMTVVSASDDNAGIFVEYAYGCWVKNCRGVMTGIHNHCAYIWSYISLRCEIRDSEFVTSGVADRYGIRGTISSGLLVENNWFFGHSTAFMVNGVSGSVYGYNYCTNVQENSGAMAATFYTHGGCPNYVLCEGNRVFGVHLDSQWQNSAYMTAFRTRATGVDDRRQTTSNRGAFSAFYGHRHATVVGCVLGTTGVNTVYQIDNGGGSAAGQTRVYMFGQQFLGSSDGTFTYLANTAPPNGGYVTNGGFDPVVTNTLVRAVNWTSATTTNSGLTLDGFLVSDLPASLYLTSKPAFFGFLRFPAIDPGDPAYSDSQTNIPAGWKFVFNADPPPAASSGPQPGPPIKVRVRVP